MKNKLLIITILFSSVMWLLVFSSCKKEDEQTVIPEQQKEMSPDKEKELMTRIEFLEQKLRECEQKSGISDTSTIESPVHDSVKVKDTTKVKDKKEKLKEKEKELNKRLDNPKSAIIDYLEYIKRGVSDAPKFDENMKKANEVWVSNSIDNFKKNYKNTKKFTVLSEPEIVSQKGETASVKVKIKKTDLISTDGKNIEQDTEMTVTYNLVADKNGKWKIKNNVVQKK